MLFSRKEKGSKKTPGIGYVRGLLHSSPRALGGFGLGIFIFLLLAVSVFPQSGTSHSVRVTWTYTQGSDAATGFNVYRSSISGGPYTKQNAAAIPVATLSYTDTNGTAGTTYYYVVTAVDSSGDESMYSAQSNGATFLGNPAVPQGVTAVAQ